MGKEKAEEDPGEVEEDPRFDLAKKELLISIVFFSIFSVVYYIIGWWGLTKPEVGYILGLPDWFFLSFIVVYLIFVVLAVLLTLRIKETPLTPWLEE